MKFIVFEGLDGAGKSTLIEGLSSFLRQKNQTVVVSREPGGSTLGEEIRTLLLKTDAEAPVPRAELLLYEAARAQHVERTIRPALKAGSWVLCDRFSASTVAFQAGGRQIDLKVIEWLNQFAVDGVKPDLSILLDLTTEEARRRMQGRELDRFEQEQKDFHERVRKSYLELAEREKNHWLVLDAALKPGVLKEQMLDQLQRRGWL